MAEPIRILQIIGIAAGGGVEAVVMNYYEHIDRSQVQFDFVIHRDSAVDITPRVESLGGRVYKVTPYHQNPLAFTWAIYRIIKKNHYRIVHSNMNTLSAFSLFAAWLAGVPVRILHNHSTSSPGETKRNIAKAILKPWAKLFANRYWACSALAAEWMYGREMTQSGTVTIIPNAIDLAKYAFNEEKRKQLRREMGLTDEFVIGHVGRFMFQKNHEFLIELFAKALQKNPRMILLLVGDGSLRGQIENKVKRLGVAEKVKFLGIRSDVQALYNAMDLFLLPSHYEGLPVVGVEAQANGLPCLVSDDVTKEMQLTSSVTYKKLSEGADAWADAILDGQWERNREVKEEMKKAGFDIEEAADTLRRRYLKLSTEGGALSLKSISGGQLCQADKWHVTQMPLRRICA